MEQGQAITTPPIRNAPTSVLADMTPVPRRRTAKPRQYLTVLLFAGPALVLIGLLVIYPAIRTIINSFFITTGIGYNAPTAFTGWTNYVNLFSDPNMQTAIRNNILWLIVVTPVTLILGVVFAVLFDRVRYEAVAKSIVFIPMAISATAAGIIWVLMYADNPHVGTINAMLAWLGAGPISFLGDAQFVNWALMGAQVWMGLGFAVVVLSAALKSIPSELVEAARIDGASEWQRFIHITVPLMWPTITVIMTLTMIGVVKVFDIVIVMTGGGPAGASEVLATRMYTEAFKNANFNYGSAIAVILLIAVLPIMLINIRRFRAEGPR